MDFTFSADQDALRATVRAFMTAEAPKEYVRRMAEHDDVGITPEMWRTIVDLGWTGVLVPEADGGLGLGVIDAVVVQEEMGRAVFPGPFFSSAIVGDARGTRARTRRPARRARGGGSNAARLRSTRPATAIRSSASACARRAVAHATKLDGVKPMVLDGHTADWVLVPARTATASRRSSSKDPPRTLDSRPPSTSRGSSHGWSSTARGRRSSGRRAITLRSGAESPTTRPCSSPPS